MNDINNRTLTLTRTFDAPRTLVWEAWTQAKHIAAWWGPGMETEVKEHDFIAGGKWCYVMTTQDRQEFTAEGVFSEIITLQKICSSANFKPMTAGVDFEALFEALGEKTNFTFKVIHPTEAYCKFQDEMGVMNGWGGNFDGLERYLSSLSR